VSDCDCFDCKVLPYKRPGQVAPAVVDALNRRDLPARLYAIERAALHFLDLAMRIRREAELGELTAEVVGLLGERLDQCAVAVACLGEPCIRCGHPHQGPNEVCGTCDHG